MTSQTGITGVIICSMKSYAEMGEMSRAGLPNSISVPKLPIALFNASIIDLYSLLESVKVCMKSPPCRIGNNATRSSSAELLETIKLVRKFIEDSTKSEFIHVSSPRICNVFGVSCVPASKFTISCQILLTAFRMMANNDP